MFQPADRVGGQQRGEIGFAAVLADGGGDFARHGGALLAQLLGFVELGGQLPQFLSRRRRRIFGTALRAGGDEPIAAWACFDLRRL